METSPPHQIYTSFIINSRMEQYIARELKEDIKYLIKKITELNEKIEKANQEEAKEKAREERAKAERSSSRTRKSSSRSTQSATSKAIVKVLTSATVIRGVFGILGKLLK